MTATKPTPTHKAVLKRTYPASAERIFAAWTQPELLAQWYKPNERWVTARADVDLRVGGRYRITMRHSDGEEFVVAGEYKEIDAPTKLAFTFNWEKNSMLDMNYNYETLVTIALTPNKEGTELVLTHSGFAEEEIAAAHNQGWSGIVDALGKFVSA